ncbi:sulfatase-like hydrolase/transferase [Haloferax volcanii]|uniref:Sulfatase-like hydrolase/transferase n=1 Tax=Haloferax volcanii TaxID=2246 RepID=A0A558G9I9_HALVO|nr:sulfatase-like hydrolase/transferase [Haloferax volcanii]TVT94424.1 sulfatase-like hydrolase/transferase [Haloferax volcanii]
MNETEYSSIAVSPHLLSGDFGIADEFDQYVWVDRPNSSLPYPNEEVTSQMHEISQKGGWETPFEKYADFLRLTVKNKSYKGLVNGAHHLYRKYNENQGNWLDDGAEEVLSKSLSLIEKSDPPVFLFANFIEPHSPYRPPKEYIYEFVDDDIPIEELNDIIAKSSLKLTAGEDELDPVEKETLIDLYDAEIKYLDSLIGNFVKDVRENDPHTKIIITSDHGDLFGEWGVWGHQAKIHPNLARVPLILSDPSKHPDRISEPVSLRDLYEYIVNSVNGNEVEISTNDVVISEYYGWDTQLAIQPWEEYDQISIDEFGQYQVALFDGQSELLVDSFGTTRQFNLMKEGLPEEPVSEELVSILEQKIGDPRQKHEKYRGEQSNGGQPSDEMKEHLEHLGYM